MAKKAGEQGLPASVEVLVPLTKPHLIGGAEAVGSNTNTTAGPPYKPNP
jgi:hypothetical protein